MRRITIDNDSDYQGITTRKSMIGLWEKNFRHEASKFISATHLQCEDLGKEFTDHNGVVWKLLGQMDGREMPCENQETKEIFIWDRWKVSQLVRPEEHLKAAKRTEFIFPTKEKRRTKKEPKLKAEQLQLNLFDEPLQAGSKVEVISAKYGAGEKLVDVTAKVAMAIKKGEKVKVTNHLGGDPAPGTPKTLTIEIIQDGNTLTKTFPEKSTVKF